MNDAVRPFQAGKIRFAQRDHMHIAHYDARENEYKFVETIYLTSQRALSAGYGYPAEYLEYVDNF